MLAAAVISVGLGLVSSPAEDEQAMAAFQEARALFEAERFEDALPLFQQAYRLSGHRPAATYALAQCERALRMYDLSIEHFREYLNTGPSNPEEVEETIEVMREAQRINLEAQRMLREREGRIAEPAPPPPEDEDQTWLWLGVGAAVLVVVGSAVAIGVATSGDDLYGGTADFVLRP